MLCNDEINRQLDFEKNKEHAREGYPTLWHQLISDWKSSSGDYAWLTYAASYIFTTLEIRWAIDPFSMSSRVSGIAQPDYVTDFAGLELVILTHAHNDHLDRNLVYALRNQPITWIIPRHMLDLVLSFSPLDRGKIIIPEHMNVIQYRDLSILPFSSLHFNGSHGISETGYLVEFNKNRWLFPIDIRNYDFNCLPDFGLLNGIFAHLWLGKGCANLPNPPKLHDFCSFFSKFKTERIILTHLDEWGRDRSEMWDETHVPMVRFNMAETSAQIEVSFAKTGDRIDLLKP